MRKDERLRAMLIGHQERIVARVTKLQADIDALADARRGESDDDEHDPEGVTLSSQWSMMAGVLEAAREDARRADDAMRRLDAGEYGVCTVCGKPIPAAQLEVRPFRESCVACAS